MLTNLFESRNKMFTSLVKLGDYLGRSLRENVELFTIEDNLVTYLTESGKIIQGNFDKSALKLNNIKVDDATIFEDKDVYSKLVDKKISGFLADILESDLGKAQDSFGSILNLWETRLHFNRIKTKLDNKCERFNETSNIVYTPEFERLVEIRDDLVKLLKESNNYINIPEIRNTIKLSSVISKSFNMPRLDYDELLEGKSFEIPNTVNHTLYDHLCKQELIAKELVESSNNLENIWMLNEKIQKLPSYIYESDDNVMQLVAEIVSEIPYFAMATKKQIHGLVEGNLDLLVDRSIVPAKDIKEFVSKIFEFKKPVKSHILNVLNEKYGINIQNLTDMPTFDSLIKTQILIFESLSKLSPKNSVLKKVLNEFSELLKTKNGIESIDVTDFLNQIFEDCEYTSILNETTLMNYLNFDKVADDLGKIGQVLKMIQAGMGGALGGAGGGAAPSPEMQSMAKPMTPGEGEYESDGGPMAGLGDESEFSDENEDGNELPAMDSGDAAQEVQDEVAMDDMEGQENGEMGEMGEEGEEGDTEFTEKGQLIDNLRELEGLLATLKSDIGVEGEGGDEDMGDDDANMVDDAMEGMEDEGFEGESEEDSESDGGEFEGEDSEGDSEESEEDSEDSEEAPPPPKKKNKFKKPE